MEPTEQLQQPEPYSAQLMDDAAEMTTSSYLQAAQEAAPEEETAEDQTEPAEEIMAAQE